MASYYLTLISGANQHDFNNTSSKFRNKLPVALEMHKDMEFGICELSYVPYINNVSTIKRGLSVFDYLWSWGELEGGKAGKYGKPMDIDIKEGYYANEIVLSQHLNDLIWHSIPRLQNKIIISYNECKRRFKIDVENHDITILFNPELCSILGINVKGVHGGVIGRSYTLGDVEVYNNEKRYLNATSSWIAEPSGYQHHLSSLVFTETLFIYCDLVFQQYSGNTFSNLLRMCAVNEVDNRRIVHHFEKIHYVPVNKSLVSTIDIHIKAIDDLFINLRGLTYVKLHFRSKQKK